MEFYRAKFKYHFRTLFDVIERTVLVSLILIYFGQPNDMLFLFPLFFLILVLPYLIIYFKYIKLSNNVLVVIDREKRQIKVQINILLKSYSFDEVKNISRDVTKRAGRRKNPKPRWGDFYYFVIELKSGEEIIITSLMTNKATIDIDGIENKIESHGIAWIPIKERNIINLQGR